MNATTIARLQTALVLSFVFLLPSKTLFNVPILVMAVCGLWVLVKHRQLLNASQSWRFCQIAFACIWIPMLIAAADAVDPIRSLKAVVLYPRFLLAGAFMIFALRNAEARRWTIYGVFFVCMFWTVDALFQYIVGFDILGYPYENGQLKGIFYPKYRLGLTLAVFLPILLDVALRRQMVHKAWLAALAGVPVVVMLTLHRNSWVSIALASGLYLLFAILAAGWRPRLRAVGIGLVGAVVIGAAVSTQSNFLNRISYSFEALSAPSDVLAERLGQRPDIWTTAVNMFESNWVNGVGPRSFRSAYTAYTEPDDYWMNLQPAQIPSHPHQIALEIAAETGALGLVGYLGVFLLLAWGWRHVEQHQAVAAGPWLLCFVVATFPANISKAFYGSATASLSWWILSVGLSVLFAAGSSTTVKRGPDVASADSRSR